MDGAHSISTTFAWKIGSKVIQAKRPGTSKTSKSNTFSIRKFLFGNFGLPLKDSRFPEKNSIWEDKINLSIYIPPEISGFFG